jgi:predicted membrane metal-binding protein
MNEEILFGNIVSSFICGIASISVIHRKIHLFVLYYTLLNMMCFAFTKNNIYYVCIGNIFIAFFGSIWFYFRNKRVVEVNYLRYIALFCVLTIPYAMVFFIRSDIKWEDFSPISISMYICCLCMIFSKNKKL